MRLTFAFAGVCLGAFGVARGEPTAAQTSSSCTAPEHRQLDFWLGDWDVYDVGGAPQSVARARITRILDGCVVHELYESADGARGESFSIFDHTRRLWHQSWVTNRGRLLQIECGVASGRVVLTGRYLDNAGRPMVIRGSWWPVPAGVREFAEVSADDGRSWKPDFDLIFRPHRD